MSISNWRGFLEEAQAEQLFKHLAEELDAEYAAFAMEVIDVDCANYCNHIEADAESFPDYSDLQKALTEVILSLHWRGHPVWLKLPNEAELVNYLGAISTRQKLIDSLRPKKGRQKKTARGDLIRAIYNVIPPGKAGKTRDSHFEATVEMILGFLGPVPKDIHKAILAALKDN